MKKTFLLILVAGAAIFSAAAQQQLPILKKAIPRAIVAKSLNPANPENPFDSVGIKHNWYLQKFFSTDNINQIKKGYEEGNVTKDNCLKRFFDNVCKPWSPFCGGTPPYNPFPDQELFRQRLAIVAEKSGQKSAINPSVITALNQLDLLFEESTKQEISQDLLKKVILFEQQVIKDASLSESEKTIVLCASSVARYTMVFWRDFYSGKIPGLIPIGGIKGAAKEGGGYGHADIAGAVDGAIVGAVTGEGVGAVPGAVVGAAAASIGEAIADLWDWITGKVVVSNGNPLTSKDVEGFHAFINKIESGNAVLNTLDVCWKCLADFIDSLIKTIVVVKQ